MPGHGFFGISGGKDILIYQKNSQLYSNSIVAASVNSCVACILYLSLPVERFDWLIIILASSTLRLSLFTWGKFRPLTTEDPTFRYKAILFAILWQGLSWGYASIVLYDLIPGPERFYLITVLVGLTGGSILTLLPSFAAFLLYVIPSLVPLLCVFIFVETDIYRSLGSMTALYLLAIITVARRINHSAIVQIANRQKLESMFVELETHQNELENLVTERTRNLKLSEERYRDSFEKAVIGMAVLGPDGRLLRTNPAFQAMLGFTASELSELTLVELCAPEDRSVWREQFTAAMNGEAVDVTLVEKLVRKNGSFAEVMISFRVTHEGNGEPLHVIAQILDLSERKQIEREQALLNESLRQNQRMESIGTLAGGIAHDFNNILTAIIGFSQILERKLSQRPEELKLLSKVLKASNRARHLVQQILVFSRNKEERREAIKLDDVVNEALQLLRQTIPATTPIQISIDPHCGSILGDSTQIHQAVINLCTNAYHAVRDVGGEIRVKLAPQQIVAQDPAEFRQLPTGRYLKLTISDTGQGMSAETRERLFEPFFTTKHSSEGTGMGMAVVYGIVKNHGGKIEVESKPGVGTSISLLFPCVDEKPVAKSSLPEVAVAGNERILFVDDEELLVDLWKMNFEGLGYQVTASTSAQAAFDLFSADPAASDLVITDQSMPELSGLQLAQKLLEIRADLPIILYTGYSELVDAQRAKAAGIRTFLMKPVDKQTLTRAVRELLESQSGRCAEV